MPVDIITIMHNITKRNPTCTAVEERTFLIKSCNTENVLLHMSCLPLFGLLYKKSPSSIRLEGLTQLFATTKCHIDCYRRIQPRIGRFSGLRIILISAPSRVVKTMQWLLADFVPDYSGGTTSDFHGIPF